ncbi:MAG: anti-sigma factor [Acidobacteriaceae bacterium]|nr:anti-sigma factor [Acidobacteriaceae bacterium]
MSCDSYSELYELYSLGLLEGKEKCEMEEHLATGCAICETGIRRALELNAIISSTVPLVDPPARLRSRILRSFREEPRRAEGRTSSAHVGWRASTPWLAFAASLLAVAGLIWRVAYQQKQNAAGSEQMSETTRILQAPETKAVPFGPQPNTEAYGKLYVNSSLGAVLTVSRLPAAPSGWTYESWIVPKAGPPRPVRRVTTQGTGQVLTLVPGPIDANTLAIAVSMEPPGARLEKPTRVLFAAPV